MFEVGKRYMTWSGDVVTLTKYLPDYVYCYKGVLDNTTFSWNKDGQINQEEKYHHLNLIPTPIKDTPPSAAPMGDADTAQSDLAHWRTRAEKAEGRLLNARSHIELMLRDPLADDLGAYWIREIETLTQELGFRIIPPQPLRVEDGE